MNASCRPARQSRSGLSLIEVIACTAIAAIMMVPVTAVMRSSRQAITHAQQRSPDTDLRDASRWLGRLIQDSAILSTQPHSIALQLSTGEVVKIGVRSHELIMDKGHEVVVLMPHVTGIEFGEIKQTASPHQRIGVKWAMNALDPNTHQKHSRTSVVSLPPQF